MSTRIGHSHSHRRTDYDRAFAIGIGLNVAYIVGGSGGRSAGRVAGAARRCRAQSQRRARAGAGLGRRRAGPQHAEPSFHLRSQVELDPRGARQCDHPAGRDRRIGLGGGVPFRAPDPGRGRRHGLDRGDRHPRQRRDGAAFFARARARPEHQGRLPAHAGRRAGQRRRRRGRYRDRADRAGADRPARDIAGLRRDRLRHLGSDEGGDRSGARRRAGGDRPSGGAVASRRHCRGSRRSTICISGA